MAQPSTTTILAVFDDYAAAERATRELMNEGIPRDAMQIQSNFRTGSAGSSSGAAATGDYESGENGNEESGFMGWWHRTFGGGEDENTTHERSSGSAFYNDDRGHFAEAVRRGGAVVAVTAAPSTLDRAVELLNSAGAVDIDRRVGAYREQGYQGFDESTPSYDYEQARAERQRYADGTGEARAGEDRGQTIPVVEEELQVGKRAVQRGGVRVYSHVVEQPVDEQINLREEHVRVERRPVNREVDAAELDNLRDQSIEVVETAEEAVVSKKARVREEVVVGKETTERTEHVRDNVRRTEVRVDQMDGPRNGYDDRYETRLQADPRFSGRSWNEIENDVRDDYSRTHAAGEWDRVKDRIRETWDRTTSNR
ncbi:MAG: YsnF/AvaK domain-containing protein [Acidobacteriota bacterium]|nr:YsnF/AvaK domain-containing protein [Acidobacteriota bacterium]